MAIDLNYSLSLSLTGMNQKGIVNHYKFVTSFFYAKRKFHQILAKLN